MLALTYYPHDARVTREAETLAAEGFDVHVVCNRKPDREKSTSERMKETPDRVNLHYLPLSRKRGTKFRYIFEFLAMTLLGIWKLTALHMKHRFHVIHIHNMPDLLVLAGLIPKWLGATLILDIHDPMNELFQANYHVTDSNPFIRLIRLQEWLCYRLPDHLITVSHPMAENVARKSGRPPKAIKVVHNCSDLGKFPLRVESQEWPRNKDVFLLLYTGTVTEHYALHIAIRAIALAAQRIKNIHFRILGAGNRLDHVLSLADELGIRNHVEYVGQVPIEDVKRFMAQADVGISTHNGGAFGDLYFSNKIVDFMTQGVPVLCSRTHTIHRYIPDEAIFYSEPGDAQEFADRIVEMHDNPILVQDKIENARNLATKYNWETEKHTFLHFYNGLTE